MLLLLLLLLLLRAGLVACRVQRSTAVWCLEVCRRCVMAGMWKGIQLGSRRLLLKRVL